MNETNSVYDVSDLNRVLDPIKHYLLRNDTSLVLDEVKSVDHLCDGQFSVNTDREHAYDSRLERVKQAEGASLSLFHVEGD